jgi:two-component system chemotaxis sensor kinase CheA
MSIDLSQFIPTFLDESFEGLATMESSLLNLNPGDNETINTIFRAAHSIKGGAGTFGFNQVTEFTHLVETLLDEMRSGSRAIEQSDIEILLDSVDCIRMLLESIKDNSTCDDTKIAHVSNLLSKSLAASMTEDEVIIAKPNNIEETKNTWQIDFIPEHHLVQTGNDPILLFNALADLGELSVITNTDDLPPLEDIDAEELYLSWRLTLITEQNEEYIMEVFECVEYECQLELILLNTSIDTEQLNKELLDLNNSATEEETTEVTPSDLVKDSLPASTLEKKSSLKSIENNTEESNTTKVKPDVGSIRVGVDKVDILINLVGELVITQSMLSELGNDFTLDKVEKLNSGLEELLQNTKELQESVMRIRMLPISFAFNRFPRLIHDLCKQTGKEIDLVIKGEQTELDKTVMEQIGDPLVHLVRNAVDHGIESAKQRVANNKPAKGTVSLNAYHQGGNIVIEINDDGGGINRDAVLNKAIEKGIVDKNYSLTEAQVFDLIFEPGFSTAAEVSDISGRGVGMDVVKRNIQALGGRIQVESKPGKGSTFKVYLPLTLAILDGQLVRVGTETYIIPLIVIVESLQAKAELINRVSGDMVVYRLREDNVPVLPIYQLFNLPADTRSVENSLLVVVEADGKKIGLMVDDLLAQQQVVVKSLKDNYCQVDGISGATILGDGSVAMILDIPGIINMAMKNLQPNSERSRKNILREVD